MAERKKPVFRRKDWHKRLRLGKRDRKNVKWRAVKGRHNKVRLGEKGHSKRPKIGWSKGKRNVKEKIIVENIKQLEMLKPKTEIIISSRVGSKKRADIVKKSIEKGLIILNYKESKNATI